MPWPFLGPPTGPRGGGSDGTRPVMVLPDAADPIGVVRGPAAAARAPIPGPQDRGPPYSASSTRFWAGSWPSIWPNCYAPEGSSSQQLACGGPTRCGRPDRHGPRASRHGPSPETKVLKVGATTVQEGRTLIFGVAFPIRTTHILGREAADRAAIGL